MALYILHEDIETPNSDDSPNIAYFGPFSEEEITDRCNDRYADLLAGSGDVDAVELSDEDAAKIYINPPQFWYDQLKQYADEDAAAEEEKK